jgi:hypothetical protein
VKLGRNLGIRSRYTSASTIEVCVEEVDKVIFHGITIDLGLHAIYLG